MAEFTKEQLIEHTKNEIEGWREAVTVFDSDDGYSSRYLAVLEIALAALTEQPVGYYRKATTGDGYYLSSTIEPQPGTIPLYRLPLLEGLK